MYRDGVSVPTALSPSRVPFGPALKLQAPLGGLPQAANPCKSSLHNKLIERKYTQFCFCFFVELQSLMLHKIKIWPQYVVFLDFCL